MYNTFINFVHYIQYDRDQFISVIFIVITVILLRILTNNLKIPYKKF